MHYTHIIYLDNISYNLLVLLLVGICVFCVRVSLHALQTCGRQARHSAFRQRVSLWIKCRKCRIDVKEMCAPLSERVYQMSMQ